VLYKNLDQPFFHFLTNHAFDRQTDKQNRWTASAFHAAR